MCGFVGQFSLNGEIRNPATIDRALQLLEHRGPDSEGKISINTKIGTLALGFRRLSIIDLSSAANQPFSSLDGRFTMLFNGEIYNYLELRKSLLAKGRKFQTSSDTEVLMASWEEWGVESLEKFTGMFSIIIYDSFRETLFGARDAFGIKPFYYSVNSKNFTFASEIPAVLAMNNLAPSLNLATATNYISTGSYDRDSETFFDGISQLQPGHLLRIEFNERNLKPEIERWWHPLVRIDEGISFEEASEQFRHEFLSSVSMHLRSDVKIATALSGGLDSSAIVGAIRHLNPDMPIHTFSYHAEGTSADESLWIKKMNSLSNSSPHKVLIYQKEFKDDLDDLIMSQGEPFSSTSVYAQFRIYKAAREEGVTVMLDGQGADEVLAGYFGYPENRLMSLLEKGKFLEAGRFLYNWSKLPGRSTAQLFRSEIGLLLDRSPDFLKPYVNSIMPFSRQIQTKGRGTDKQDPYLTNYDWKGRRLSERLQLEQFSGVLSSLLRHSDRNSMRWSIESRVPFLTPQISRLALSFPENYLLSSKGQTKSVFRHAMKGLVDLSVIERMDKIGFKTPENEWFEPSIYQDDQFLYEIKDTGFMAKSDFRDIFHRKLIEGNSNSLRWRAYNLQRWMQLFKVDTY